MMYIPILIIGIFLSVAGTVGVPISLRFLVLNTEKLAKLITTIDTNTELITRTRKHYMVSMYALVGSCVIASAGLALVVTASLIKI